MSQDPLPFGDPTNIDREHRAAVRKGVGVGCGAVAAIVLAVVAMVASVFAFVIFIMHQQEPCVLALKAAQQSAILKNELGEPISMGWLVTGSTKTNGGDGTAMLNVPINGPKGEATILVVGTRSHKTWTFNKLEATVKKSGLRVDLR